MYNLSLLVSFSCVMFAILFARGITSNPHQYKHHRYTMTNDRAIAIWILSQLSRHHLSDMIERPLSDPIEVTAVANALRIGALNRVCRLPARAIENIPSAVA
jgi:hypothetical protein